MITATYELLEKIAYCAEEKRKTDSVLLASACLLIIKKPGIFRIISGIFQEYFRIILGMLSRVIK
jgi:hypothetical protein